MKTRLAILSVPPEIEIDDKFFNKACCYLPDLGVCDYINLPEKGLTAMTAYDAEIGFISSPKKLAVKVDSIDKNTATPVSIKIGK